MKKHVTFFVPPKYAVWRNRQPAQRQDNGGDDRGRSATPKQKITTSNDYFFKPHVLNTVKETVAETPAQQQPDQKVDKK